MYPFNPVTLDIAHRLVAERREDAARERLAREGRGQ